MRSGIAPVAMISPSCARMIVGMPDSCLIIVPLMWRLMPPIRRTRMIVAPVNNISVSPIKIAIQPPANRKADAESNEWRAIPGLIINHVRLVNRHINHLRISRNNFNVAAVIDYLLLRRRLQVAEIIRRRAQPLDGTHHVRLLIEKSLSQFRRQIQVVIHPFQHAGIAGHGLDAGVPWLLANLVGIAAASDITVRSEE